MYPFYSAEQSSLDSDDVEGLCQLYSDAGGECGGCDDGLACLDGRCVLLCALEICDADEACGVRGCVPAGACTELDCVGDSCTDDVTCGPTSRCTGGVCVRGTAALGDACEDSRTCAEGTCARGVCQPECAGEGPCGKSGQGSCQPATEEGLFGCEGSGEYLFGASCVRGEDCTSGICATTESGTSCTEECSSDAACAPGNICSQVDGRFVCLPPELTAAGGCGLADSNAAKWPAACWLLGGVVVTIARRKTKEMNR